jgi:CelD/BcsL family acetyltransferase involved in cellulose biosynthesis
MGPILHSEWSELEKYFYDSWGKIVGDLIVFDAIHLQKQRKYMGDMLNPFFLHMNNVRRIKAYQVNLADSWNDYYFDHVTRKLRADSNRQRRRLSKIGDVEFINATKSCMKKDFIRAMIRQKSLRYREKGLRDLFSLPQYKSFYEGLADFREEELQVHCAGLRVGTTLVATHVGIVHADTFYYLMPAHEDENWGKYSPGRLLLEHLLEWAIAQGLRVFDFTGGGERYKLDWCNSETQLYETLKPYTKKGVLYTILLYGRRELRNIFGIESEREGDRVTVG